MVFFSRISRIGLCVLFFSCAAGPWFIWSRELASTVTRCCPLCKPLWRSGSTPGCLGRLLKAACRNTTKCHSFHGQVDRFSHLFPQKAEVPALGLCPRLFARGFWVLVSGRSPGVAAGAGDHRHAGGQVPDGQGPEPQRPGLQLPEAVQGRGNQRELASTDVWNKKGPALVRGCFGLAFFQLFSGDWVFVFFFC